MTSRAFLPVGVAVFGLSTAFGYWGFDLVHRVVEALTGKTARLHILSLEQLREGFGQREGGSVVVTSDWPEADLVDFVCVSDLPILTFSEDLGDMLDWIISTRDFEYKDGARYSASMLSSLAPAFASERALNIRGARDSSPFRICAAVIEHLFPGLSEELVSSAFDHLVQQGYVKRETTTDWTHYTSYKNTGKLNPEELEYFATIKSAFTSHDDLLNGVVPAEIIWPLELFSRTDQKSSRAPFELIGPARVLFYGPNMFLPVGDWTARVEFEIHNALSGVEVTTDVYLNGVVTEKMFEMPANGIFAYNLSFRVESPRMTIQIRVYTRKSAIEGMFLLRSILLRPATSAVRPPSPVLSPPLRQLT